jgi:hypothetical protein
VHSTEKHPVTEVDRLRGCATAYIWARDSSTTLSSAKQMSKCICECWGR